MLRKPFFLLFAALILSVLLLPSACAPMAAESTPTRAIELPATPTELVSITVPAVTVEPASKPTALNVLAAASLTSAFKELGAQFEANHPGVTIQFNFAGSQQLAQQLVQGAPADIFASANKKQMDVVIEAGRIEKDAARTLVQNRLVIVLPKDNPARLEGLKDLAKTNLKLVFAAKEVPVGQYSLDFLDKAVAEGTFPSDYKEKVLANVVSYEDNVKSVLTKVALGEADAGIVYTSDVTGADAKKVGRIEIPDALNIIATYPIALLKDSANTELAQQFIDLMLSQGGQAVLERYGFIPAAK
jgi:molybdate transport system substrate-binding protein